MAEGHWWSVSPLLWWTMGLQAAWLCQQQRRRAVPWPAACLLFLSSALELFRPALRQTIALGGAPAARRHPCPGWLRDHAIHLVRAGDCGRPPLSSHPRILASRWIVLPPGARTYRAIETVDATWWWCHVAVQTERTARLACADGCVPFGPGSVVLLDRIFPQHFHNPSRTERRVVLLLGIRARSNAP